MAILTSNNKPLKLALLSTGIFSVAVLLKLSVPFITYFTVSELHVLAWLQPPYLYLIINGIIISIVASSKLQLQKSDEPFKQFEMDIPPGTEVIAGKSSGAGDLLDFIDDTGYVGHGSAVSGVKGEEMKGSDADSKRVVQSIERSDSLEELFQKLERDPKPLVSSRFGHKKSSLKAGPEGSKASVLGVSKAKRHDTLESTWKMITDGRSMPLTRHLKKSDTWDSHFRRGDGTNPPPPPAEKMKKSETFSEKSKPKLSHKNRQGSEKLKKEASLTQDELNRRVEAFINKFNEEMRLQREESLNQFQEMINRGAF
ncbi:uncharacterized protein LOC126667853 [Mercurialis annua]|uniref:uncharacterized protein LOC126667853 n=1 Tax=Mercurialis annua TaxID=3986 RepID=UPI00215FA984|nr:uncharacterized protein LOC126667853 [Mercurialis annua]